MPFKQTVKRSEHTPMPDSPGEWWFTGDTYVPNSTTPGNGTTVHVERPRRFLIVETHYGLIPFEPANFYPYPHVTFTGKWEKAYTPQD